MLVLHYVLMYARIVLVTQDSPYTILTYYRLLEIKEEISYLSVEFCALLRYLFLNDARETPT